VLDGLRANLGLKILALVLAVAGWAYLRFADHPVVSARFEQSLTVPISAIGLGPDLVARPNDRQATVTVVVPRTGTTTLRADSIRAILDLSDRAQGLYSVPLRVVAPDLQISRISPPSVTVAVEHIEEKNVPISVHYIGTIHVVADDVNVAPTQLAVRGAASDIARVSSMRIDLQLPNKGGAIDTMARPIPTDAQGGEVEGVTSSRSLVRVRATFSAAHAPA
jgi:YbbR domain-containing protein